MAEALLAVADASAPVSYKPISGGMFVCTHWLIPEGEGRLVPSSAAMAVATPRSRARGDVEARMLLALAGLADGTGFVRAAQLNRRLARISARQREAALKRLIRSGLVAARPQGRKTVGYRLTSGGVRAVLHVELGPRQRISGGELNSLLALLRSELAPMPAHSAGPSGRVEAVSAGGVGQLPAFDSLVIEEAQRLAAASDGGGGLVPIHRLRERLAGRLDRAAFDGCLFALARSGRLAFHKLTDVARATPRARAASLHHPIKGLLYYLSVGGRLQP